MKPDYTDITIVLDRSGSMDTVKKDTIGGYDRFIADQAKLPGKATVSLAQFDTKYESVYQGLPVSQVPPLNLVPRGYTALLDAIGRTINETGTRFKAMEESERPAKVLFVIITDGQENASTEFSREMVFSMISHQREKYDWTFVFLGANQDAITVGSALGIATYNNLTYTANSAGTMSAYSSLSNATKTLRSSSSRSTVMAFDADDRELQKDALKK